MKKSILFLVLMAFGITTLNSQERDRDQDTYHDQDRFILVDGDILQIRDRDQIRLKDALTLNDGTTMKPNGTYQTRDRKQWRLKDGECLDMDGIKYRNEYQYRFKVKQENIGLSQAQFQERNKNRTQLMLIDGDVYQIRNQIQNQLHQQLNFANGGSINTDGKYMTRDLQQLHLLDGECLDMDGNKFKNTYTHRKMKMRAKKNMMKQKIILIMGLAVSFSRNAWLAFGVGFSGFSGFICYF